MIPLPNGRRLTAGDLTILVALVAVVYVLVRPTLGARAFDDSVEALAGSVEELRRGAAIELGRSGAWPSTGEPGALPRELRGTIPEDVMSGTEGYRLRWMRWSVIDSVTVVEMPTQTAPLDPDDAPPTDGVTRRRPVVRTVGSVVVYADDPHLLGALLQRYGRAASFVRDTTWTLILPGRGER